MSVLQNAEFVKYEDVVPCIAHRTKNHGSTEVVDPRTKQTRKSCEKYPSISCDIHEAFLSVRLEHSYTPASFICGPDGAPLVKPDDAKGWDRSVAGLVKKLQEVQQKLGRPLPRALHDKVLADLEEADQSLADEKYEKAVKTVQKYAEDKRLPASMREGRLKAKLAALEAKGDELVEAARAKRDSAPEEALKLAKRVQRDWKGLEAAKKAAELVKDWEGSAGAEKS